MFINYECIVYYELDCFQEYIASGWNLNNLPVLDLSVLRHVSGDISGMMVKSLSISLH